MPSNKKSGSFNKQREIEKKRRKKRKSRLIFFIILIIIVSSVVMTLIAEIIAGYLAGIFVSYDNNLLELTTEAIRIYAVSYLISGVNIFASSFFTALNNGVVSAVISFMRMFVFQIVMILLLPVVLGISGIWTAVIAAEVLSVVISVMFLVKNRKKYSY